MSGDLHGNARKDNALAKLVARVDALEEQVRGLGGGMPTDDWGAVEIVAKSSHGFSAWNAVAAAGEGASDWVKADHDDLSTYIRRGVVVIVPDANTAVILTGRGWLPYHASRSAAERLWLSTTTPGELLSTQPTGDEEPWLDLSMDSARIGTVLDPSATPADGLDLSTGKACRHEKTPASMPTGSWIYFDVTVTDLRSHIYLINVGAAVYASSGSGGTDERGDGHFGAFLWARFDASGSVDVEGSGNGARFSTSEYTHNIGDENRNMDIGEGGFPFDPQMSGQDLMIGSSSKVSIAKYGDYQTIRVTVHIHPNDFETYCHFFRANVLVMGPDVASISAS